MNSSQDNETRPSTLVSWGWVNQTEESATSSPISSPISSPVSPLKPPAKNAIDILRPLRNWLDKIEVKEAGFAHFLCKQIPSQCPFERRIQFKGRTLLYIPPLCKLNPVYDEVVALRFRALCYLADECGEDISSYC
jgi:Mo-dependent nitrogenase C-terminus